MWIGVVLCLLLFATGLICFFQENEDNCSAWKDSADNFWARRGIASISSMAIASVALCLHLMWMYNARQRRKRGMQLDSSLAQAPSRTNKSSIVLLLIIIGAVGVQMTANHDQCQDPDSTSMRKIARIWGISSIVMGSLPLVLGAFWLATYRANCSAAMSVYRGQGILR